MHIRFNPFISAILLFLFSQNLTAQIVSLDERRTKDAASGLQGDVNFTLNFINNENQVLNFGNKLNLQLNDSLNTYMVYSDISLSRTDDVNDLNYGSFGAIYNHKAVNRVISAEALMQYQYNGNKKLRHRYIVGGGPRWKMIDRDGLKLSVVAYTIYFNELYESTVTSQKSMAKFSTMLSFYTKLSENTSIKHNTYYEPDYANPSDYRIDSQTTFQAKFNKRLSYKLYARFNYVSMVPDDIDNFDYSLQNSLSYSF